MGKGRLCVSYVRFTLFGSEKRIVDETFQTWRRELHITRECSSATVCSLYNAAPRHAHNKVKYMDAVISPSQYLHALSVIFLFVLRRNMHVVIYTTQTLSAETTLTDYAVSTVRCEITLLNQVDNITVSRNIIYPMITGSNHWWQNMKHKWQKTNRVVSSKRN